MTYTEIPNLQLPYTHHIFITHCDVDRDVRFAKNLLKILEKAGYYCMFAGRDFEVGAAKVDNIVKAILSSRRIVMILSKEALESEWCRYEMLVALDDDVNRESQSIIPVLRENITIDELPPQLKLLTCVQVSREPDYLHKLQVALSANDGNWITRLPAGNVAHGLAWSYYYGYLGIVLPGLQQRIMQSDYWRRSVYRNMCKKIILLFPESCRCYNSLSDQDSCISFEGHIDPVVKSRAGTVARTYRNTVYSVRDSEKKYYFIGEYITAIHTMYEMEQNNLAGLSTQHKLLQSTKFYITVQNILNLHRECDDTYRIIYYKDNSAKKHIPRISELVLQTIKTEIDNELKQERQSDTTDHLDRHNRAQIFQQKRCENNIMTNGESRHSTYLCNIREQEIHSGKGNCHKTPCPHSHGISQNENVEGVEGSNSLSDTDTGLIYEFLHFDKPELIKDPDGKPKSIQKGEDIVNLLIPPGYINGELGKNNEVMDVL